jgi:TadE-like protein
MTGAELWKEVGVTCLLASVLHQTISNGKTLDMNAHDPRNDLILSGPRWLRQKSVSDLRERGQSLVELAFMLPLLLLLLVGIIEIGRFAFYSILVANAARAGAQYGSQSLAAAADAPGIRTAGTNDAPGIVAPNTLTVSSTQRCGCSSATLGACGALAICIPPGHPLVYVRVQADGRFHSLFNYPGLPEPLNVTSVNEMRVAQ